MYENIWQKKHQMVAAIIFRGNHLNFSSQKTDLNPNLIICLFTAPWEELAIQGDLPIINRPFVNAFKVKWLPPEKMTQPAGNDD